MENNDGQRFVIVSGTTNKGTDHNGLRFFRENYEGAQEAVGVFQGLAEGCLFLPLSPLAPPGEELFIRLIATALGQSSVLWVDAGYACLVHTETARWEPVGPWREVTSEEAKAAESSTQIGERFFVASK